MARSGSYLPLLSLCRVLDQLLLQVPQLGPDVGFPLPVIERRPPLVLLKNRVLMKIEKLQLWPRRDYQASTDTALLGHLVPLQQQNNTEETHLSPPVLEHIRLWSTLRTEERTPSVEKDPGGLLLLSWTHAYLSFGGQVSQGLQLLGTNSL